MGGWSYDPSVTDDQAGDAPPGSGEPVVEVLAEVWASMASACTGLTPEEWERPTDCPGWSVRDQLSHIIGFERVLAGEQAPPAVTERPDHVRNDVGAINEAMVEARRSEPGGDVLAEFVAVTGQRLAGLRALPPDRFDEIGWSPLGEQPFREMLRTRLFDSWIHEQDIRRALGRPGGRGGGGEAETLDRVASTMPFVVGKKVKPPEGSTVDWAVEGPLPRHLRVAVRAGRGRAEDPVGDPTVGFVMPADAFWRLGCGRSTPEDVRREGAVTISGDTELGSRVLDAMNFMF